LGEYYNVEIYGTICTYFADIKWMNFMGGGIGSAVGSLGNMNILGSYLAISSMALLRGNWKYFIVLPMAGILASGSLMGICSFIGGAGYYFNNEYNFVSKKTLYTGAVVFMALFWIGGGFKLDSGRIAIWNRSLKSTRGIHLILGDGPGRFADKRIITTGFNDVALETGFFAIVAFNDFLAGKEFPKEAPIFGDGANMAIQEHNEYLALFNVFGIPGLILLFFLFKNFLNAPDFGVWPVMLFASFLNSYGHFSLHQSTTAILIVITACVCMAKGNKDVIYVER